MSIQIVECHSTVDTSGKCSLSFRRSTNRGTTLSQRNCDLSGKIFFEFTRRSPSSVWADVAIRIDQTRKFRLVQQQRQIPVKGRTFERRMSTSTDLYKPDSWLRFLIFLWCSASRHSWSEKWRAETNFVRFESLPADWGTSSDCPVSLSRYSWGCADARRSPWVIRWFVFLWSLPISRNGEFRFCLWPVRSPLFCSLVCFDCAGLAVVDADFCCSSHCLARYSSTGLSLSCSMSFFRRWSFNGLDLKRSSTRGEDEEKEKSDSVRDQRNRWKLRFDSVALPKKNKETEGTLDSARQSVHRHFFWAARVSLVLCREWQVKWTDVINKNWQDNARSARWLVTRLATESFSSAVRDLHLADSLMMSGVTLSLVARGHILVLLPFYPENNLQTINGRCVPSSDHFSVNMAIADFLVGSFCIPSRSAWFSFANCWWTMVFSLTHSWPFGRLFCQIWVRLARQLGA